LLTHRPGIIVVVCNETAGVTNLAINVSPSAGLKFVVEMVVWDPILGDNIKSSRIGDAIGID
jgi:hypothetical protein